MGKSSGLSNVVKSLFNFDIEKHERGKFFGLAIIMFCVLFNYNLTFSSCQVKTQSYNKHLLVSFVKHQLVVFLFLYIENQSKSAMQ